MDSYIILDVKQTWFPVWKQNVQQLQLRAGYLRVTVVSGWLRKTEFTEYLEWKNTMQSPDYMWCILVHEFNEILSKLNICFRSLKDRRIIIVEQNYRLSMYSFKFQSLIGAKNIQNSALDVCLEAANAGVDFTGSDVISERGKNKWQKVVLRHSSRASDLWGFNCLPAWLWAGGLHI